MQVTIDPNKLYTKSRYAREYGMARSTLDIKIRQREIKSIEVKGTILVIAT